MTLSISAWLQYKIDDYQFSVHDLAVDRYIAQAKLNHQGCAVEQLRVFNNICLDMAELCQLNGDDESYLNIMGKLHHLLVAELSSPLRDRLFRMQAWQLARHSLSRLCHQLALNGDWDSAARLQSDFVKHASSIM